MMDDKTLRKLQLVQLEILKEVDRLCEKYALRYFLVAGTLLGAIRHKGFIPWDDDLDIAMPREDYEKFLKIAEGELSKQYYVQDINNDDTYWLPFAKVRKNCTIFEEPSAISNNTHKGIYIDIFPLDNVNKQYSTFQTMQAKIVKNISAIIFRRNKMVSVKQASIITKLLCFLSKPISISKLASLQLFIMNWNKDNTSNYFVNLGSQYNFKKQTMPKNKYYPAVKVEFEGKFYNAPRDWEYILKRIYGDYMKLPPIEQRVTHNPVKIKFEDGEEINYRN